MFAIYVEELCFCFYWCISSAFFSQFRFIKHISKDFCSPPVISCSAKLRKKTPPVLIPTLNRNLSVSILDNRPVYSTRDINMRQAEVENHENNCSSPNSWYSERGVLTLEDIRNQHHNNHNMLTLEDLKSHYSSCFTCGVSWMEDHVSLDCFECGGYSMQRPCPICEGKCQRTWNRDIAMTHAMHKAHWEGECGLPAGDREAFFIKTLVEASEESITEALKDLKATS